MAQLKSDAALQCTRFAVKVQLISENTSCKCLDSAIQLLYLKQCSVPFLLIHTPYWLSAYNPKYTFFPDGGVVDELVVGALVPLNILFVGLSANVSYFFSQKLSEFAFVYSSSKASCTFVAVIPLLVLS